MFRLSSYMFAPKCCSFKYPGVVPFQLAVDIRTLILLQLLLTLARFIKEEVRPHFLCFAK